MYAHFLIIFFFFFLEKNLKRGEIDCFELHKLVTADSSKLSFLIMDVRPPGHYEESHVNHKNILNISYDKIQPGFVKIGLHQYLFYI